MKQSETLQNRSTLESADDIKIIVDSFYARVQEDALIGPFFDEVASVDWAAHLPRMYAFWETVVFSNAGYKGDPIGKHLAVSSIAPLEQKHFERWLSLFKETIEALYTGPNAELMINRATIMAHAIQFKCAQQALEGST